MRSESDLRWAFNQLDKDSDGYISLADFKKAFGFKSKNDCISVSTKVQGEVWKEVDTEFKKIDSDSKGKIDFKAFKAYMYQL